MQVSCSYRLRLCPVFVFLFVAGLVAQGHPQSSHADTQVLIEDFDDGNDDGWTRHDNTIAEPWGPGVFDATSGSYHLENDSLASPGGGSGLLATWDGSADPVYSNGFWRAKVRADSDDTFLALALRTTASTPQSLDAYLFGAAADGSFAIQEIFDSGARGSILARETEQQLTSGEDWILEAGAVGNVLTLKYWQDGEPEPATPQLTATSSAFSSGLFGVEANVTGNLPMDGLASATFDDIYFQPPLPGDFNFNGVVDAPDYTLWRDTFSSVVDLRADGNFNGIVDAPDYTVWRDNFGNTAEISVPEPASMLLLMTTAVAISLCRCKGAT